MKEDVFCTNAIYDGVYFESNYFIVAYDISPVVEGHSLLIPKRHVVSFIDLTKDEIQDMLYTLKIIIPKLISIYGDESISYNLITQVGPFSGMSIPHLHTHILPRNKKESEDVNNVYKNIEKVTRLSPEKYKEEVERLRKVFKYKSQDKLPKKQKM